MREVRASFDVERKVHHARKQEAFFTPEQIAKIEKVYEQQTRTKNEVRRLQMKGFYYEFAFWGKKNRYLTCPETKFEFFACGICRMSKDNAQGTGREYKYYEF